MKSQFLLMLLLSVFIQKTIAQSQLDSRTDTTHLADGDLLFQDLDCGTFCDAIEEVTCGFNNANLSHIGIVVMQEDSCFVIEAVSNGVCKTSLCDFLSRSYDNQGRPKVIVGRLKDSYKGLIPHALSEAKKLIGKPYDQVFDIHNNAYYCSELIYEVFLKANNNHAIFELQPMTYISPKTKKTYEIWEEYFKKQNIPIPEGNMGINPGGISRSLKLDVFYLYGLPSVKTSLGLKN